MVVEGEVGVEVGVVRSQLPKSHPPPRRRPRLLLRSFRIFLLLRWDFPPLLTVHFTLLFYLLLFLLLLFLLLLLLLLLPLSPLLLLTYPLSSPLLPSPNRKRRQQPSPALLAYHDHGSRRPPLRPHPRLPTFPHQGARGCGRT